MSHLIQQGVFVFRFRYLNKFTGFFRKFFLNAMGMKIGNGTIMTKSYISWPHQVVIGKNCILENNLYFKYDGIWKKGPSIIIKDNVFIGFGCEFNIRENIVIGNHCNIASGCRFIDHDHGIKAGQLIGPQIGPVKAIELGEDVWLGCNVIILKGVIIGDGAVVGAGSVVTTSILPNEIWAGIPARKISERK
ncbi:MAG: lacA 2 [Mucilaginibacter sp.]|nr:lacA 2 [Mucilaginibacter sp.]